MPNGGGIRVGDLMCIDLGRLEDDAAVTGGLVHLGERLEALLAASKAEMDAGGVPFYLAIHQAIELALGHLRAVAGAGSRATGAGRMAISAAKRVAKWADVVEDARSRELAAESEDAVGEACRGMLLAALRLERDAGAWQEKGWRRLGLNHKAYFLKTIAKKYQQKFDVSMGAFDEKRKLLAQATVPAGDGAAIDTRRLLKAGVITTTEMPRKPIDPNGSDGELARAEETLHAQRAALGDDHPAVARARYDVGRAYKRLGRYGEALAAYEEALHVQCATLGDDHTEVAQTRVCMSIVHRIQGRHEQALKLYEETLRFQRASGDNRREVAQTHNGMGVVYDRQGRYNEALEAFREALVIWRATLGDAHADTALARANMGDMLGKLGRHQDALDECNEAMRAYRAAGLGDDHPYAIDALKTIARERSALSSSK